METVHPKNIDFLKDYLNSKQFNWINYSHKIEISYFASGGGTHLYLIKNEAEFFLARINFYPGKNDWGVKTQEFETLKEIESLHIAPKVFDLNTNNILGQDFTIVEYIEGENVKEFENKEIKMLAADLLKLHQYRIEGSEQATNSYFCEIFDEFSQGTDKQIEQYQFDGVETVAPLYNEIKNDLGEWFNGLSIFDNSKNECLCHADLKSENILVTKTGVKLIDWECSGVDIPETDIGRLFSGCGFTDEQQTVFLSEYYGSKPEKAVLDRVYAIKTVLDFFRIIEDYCIHKRKTLDAKSFLNELRNFESDFNEAKKILM